MRNRVLRTWSFVMANIFFYVNVLSPVSVFALTSGPSQPEVQSFEPINTTQLVDVSTGDFTYNIPLIDVGGYPINISYHSGVGMDQEASWVGLGWNVNPGVINRDMRGIPDDSDGDEIKKAFNIKKDYTFGLDVGVNFEFGGYPKVGMGLGLGMNYNNYRGYGFEAKVSPSYKFTNKVSMNLDLESSAQNGVTASLGPKINFGSDYFFKVGAGFNTRAGLKTLSWGVGNTKSYKKYTSNGVTKYVADSRSDSQSKGGAITLGYPTFAPNIEMPLSNWGITASFKFGGIFFGADALYNIGGYGFWQELAYQHKNRKSYGYLYSHHAANTDEALLDFNRAKDGVFTPATPRLPITNFTYDTYAISGQGVGGAFRPFRSDVGFVNDPFIKTLGMDGSFAADIGVGNIFKAGTDLAVNTVQKKSGRWDQENPLQNILKFQSDQINDDYEPYYFKEFGDFSTDDDPMYDNIIDDEPVYVGIKKKGRMRASTDLNSANDMRSFSGPLKRQNRKKRNSSLSFLTVKEAKKFGVDTKLYEKLYAGAKDSHIGELTVLKADGMRYIYGLPAYNCKQVEAVMATGNVAGGSPNFVDHSNGLVAYTPGKDNSVDNKRGLDHYFSSTETPAHAHSYLITAVLSNDYYDNDRVAGPSPDDMGNYTKFNYAKISNFQWRHPVQENQAVSDLGQKSNDDDDKGSYVYGEKEVWYVESIETKNFVAVFNTSDRLDALGVKGENGGVNTSVKLKKLDNIKLYSRDEYEKNKTDLDKAVPLKSVFFEYDYSLCEGVPNHVFANPSDVLPTIASDLFNKPTRDAEYVNTKPGRGKLTLRKIFFSYQNSELARTNPYVFDYSTQNPSYNPKKADRWGSYKDFSVFEDIVDDPYTLQHYEGKDNSKVSENIEAWHLTTIHLPSGGKTEITYEAKDYSFVQDKRSMQMLKVLGVGDSPTPSSDNGAYLYDKGIAGDGVTGKTQNNYIYFDLPKYVLNEAEFKERYIGDMTRMYFNFLVNLRPVAQSAEAYEYVKGYTNIEGSGVYDQQAGMYRKGYIKLKLVNVGDDNITKDVNPIAKAAVQLCRLQFPNIAFDAPKPTDSDADINSILTKLAGMFTSYKEFIYGPNNRLLQEKKCKQIKPEKSFIRLQCGNLTKLGGGVRVKSIKSYDAANSLAIGAESTYGQEFDYTMMYDFGGLLGKQSISSGVAAYEPLIGGDELPQRQPIDFKSVEQNYLVPDDKYYMEEPFGEAMYPAPQIIYSQVSVRDMVPLGVKKHATGKVVHYFYTAKDFPVKSRSSQLDSRLRKPWTLQLLKVHTINYFDASQGHVVELNDMHGKARKQEVYSETGTLISSVEYLYKSKGDQLVNEVDVIMKDGKVSTKPIGVDYDLVFDSRFSKVASTHGGLHINLETFYFIGPLVLPMIIPAYSRDIHRFRSIASTKVIYRYGILDKVVATNHKSVIQTQNIAWDGETGQVLVSSVQNEYEDPVYSFAYPAHWAYDRMGQAFKNINLTVQFKTKEDVNGVDALLLQTDNMDFGSDIVDKLYDWLAVGDEMYRPDEEGSTKYYITALDKVHNKIQIMSGDPNAQDNDHKSCRFISNGDKYKIIRSGRRNMQSLAIGNVTSLTSPIKTGSDGNRFLEFLTSDRILSSAAVEYGDRWKYDCSRPANQLGSSGQGLINVIFEALNGNFRANKSYTYLKDRNFNTPNGNRKDGYYSFDPFWVPPAASERFWKPSKLNWTLVNLVTGYDQYAGQETDVQDAIGINSTAVFGHRHAVPVITGANASSQELLIDNFEDIGKRQGYELLFKNYETSSDYYHTGRNSGKVVKGNNAVILEIGTQCDEYGTSGNTSTTPH